MQTYLNHEEGAVFKMFGRWGFPKMVTIVSPIPPALLIAPLPYQKVESNSSLESRWACDSLVTNRRWQKGHCVASGPRSKTQPPSQQLCCPAAATLCGSPATWRAHLQALWSAALALQSPQQGARCESKRVFG